MKRKKKNIQQKKLPLSKEFLNKLECSLHSRKFKMILEGTKLYSYCNLLSHVYEIDIGIDCDSCAYIKFYDNKKKVSIIFYSVFDEEKEPIYAFEVELDIKKYLDIIELLLLRNKTRK